MTLAQESVTVDEAVSLLSYDLLTSGRSLAGIANIVLNYAKNQTRSAMGYVSVIDPETRNNICHTLTGMIGDSCRMDTGMKGIVFPIGEDGRYPTLWGHSLNTRQGFYTNDPAGHEASLGLPRGHAAVGCFLSVPALSGDRVLGQISLANAPDCYGDGHLEAVTRMACVFAFALDRLQLQNGAARENTRPRAGDHDEISDLIASVLEDRDSLLKELKERLATYLLSLEQW